MPVYIFLSAQASCHTTTCMKPSIIVWDLETVPDLGGFAAANDLVGSRTWKSARRSATGSRSTFTTRLSASEPSSRTASRIIGLLILLLLSVLAYLITQGHGMAERNTQQAQQARDELRRIVGFSAADEIEKLDRLKKAGSITDAEFSRLRAKLVQ